jgi:hypothetical protein
MLGWSLLWCGPVLVSHESIAAQDLVGDDEQHASTPLG